MDSFNLSMAMFFAICVGLGCLAFWIWMLVDCATKEPDTGNTKVCWLMIILFAHIIGALIYYFVRYRPRWAEVGR